VEDRRLRRLAERLTEERECPLHLGQQLLAVERLTVGENLGRDE
jgi:hypothetical protein